jgi:hypothetical protein
VTRIPRMWATKVKSRRQPRRRPLLLAYGLPGYARTALPNVNVASARRQAGLGGFSARRPVEAGWRPAGGPFLAVWSACRVSAARKVPSPREYGGPVLEKRVVFLDNEKKPSARPAPVCFSPRPPA